MARRQRRRSPDTSKPERDVPSGSDESRRLFLHEERLEVTKKPRQVGEVRVTKRTREESASVQLPVETTTVETSRRKVEARAPEHLTPYQEGDATIIPVVEERLEVETVPYVVEEIVVRQVRKTETRQVTAAVRREEIDVETTGDVEAEPIDEPQTEEPDK